MTMKLTQSRFDGKEWTVQRKRKKIWMRLTRNQEEQEVVEQDEKQEQEAKTETKKRKESLF